jgi:hypothetical protein
MSVCRACGPKSPVERFVFDFGWGDLKDHWEDCEDCDGTGLAESDGSGPPDFCPNCDGDGRMRWGSFYEADTGHCPSCEQDDVRIAEMYEADGRGREWVCLPCYVMQHRDGCGCDLWRDAEMALPSSPEQGASQRRCGAGR